MTRLLVWLILFYIIWRIISSLSRRSVPPGDKRANDAPASPAERFSHVQDAEFEDITPKKPSDASPSG